MNQFISKLTELMPAMGTAQWQGFSDSLVPTQAAILGAGLVLILILARPMRKHLKNRLAGYAIGDGYLARLARELVRAEPYILLLTICWLGLAAMQARGHEARLLSSAASLLLAWTAIRFGAAFILTRTWARVFAMGAWAVAALHILGLRVQAAELLDSLALDMGEVHISLLTILKAAFVLVLLFKLGSWVTNSVEKRLLAMPDLTPSARVLLSKMVKAAVVVVVAVTGLSSVGINLAGLAVFSGAVGVGVGFGLQKVVANLVSGFILLADKSIKPGDVIQMGEVYGWINDLRARFVSVVTRDGMEYLIPNEDLITNKVVNLSYSDRFVRQKIPVGISYGSDLRLAMDIMVRAAENHPRTVKDRGAVCLLKGFGDSSVDLEARFWIQDPENGVSNVKSEILLDIWDGFHSRGIEIPFPQRDLHLDPEVTEALSGSRGGGKGPV